MLTHSVLPESFYTREVVEIARDLLGARLVRNLDGARISGWIVETEAYRGEEDQACHARNGRTPRTEVMYGPAGRAYVYFTYGMHWLLNAVTGAEGFPAAVLIRAIFPTEGIDLIASRRSKAPQKQWTDGPGKVCQALGINGQLNGANLSDPNNGLWIERGIAVPERLVVLGPRVGINSTPEPWLSIPWRFRILAQDQETFFAEHEE